jgi:hypothetical protein
VRQPFGVLNGMLGADGKVREVFFFLSWEEAQAAAGVPAR